MNDDAKRPQGGPPAGVLMLSVSGARGIVGAGMTAEVASRLAASFAVLVGPGVVVVGRDTRPSGAMLRDAAAAGLAAGGCEALDIGVATTPTVQVLVEEERAAGGIAVTASHNPIEWNALKFVSARGAFLGREESARLHALFREASGRPAPSGPGRVTPRPDADDIHLARVLSLPLLHRERIAERRLRVAIDCVNGAGSRIAPRLLKDLGCSVAAIHAEPDGTFPRGPEPVPRHLAGLCAAVLRTRSDVGFALDPDGDRLAIVDADGVPVGEEMTLALAAELVLSRGVGTVVANVSTSMVLDDVARRHGAVVRRTPVGEANVVAAMEETGAVLGGEGNGGVILPEAHMGRDALVGMALVLELLAERGATLAGIARALPTYVIDKVTAPGTIPDPAALSAALQALLPGATIDATDGIKLLWSDAWIHVRGSGTEPVVRIIAETPDPSRTAALIRAARACLARG